jgi:hypothetical protein
MPTTRGYVQRMTWLAPGPMICVAIGSEPTSVEVFFLQIKAGDTQAKINGKKSLISFLVDAQLSGCEVSVTHGSTSAEITAAGAIAADPSTNPLQVDAIEVTQAIQDLGHSIPLIAGKRTIVRVYLSNYSSVVANVSGAISIRKYASDASLTINSLNTVTLVPAEAGNILVKRNDASKSLNFVLPASHTVAGTLAITLAGITNTATSTTIPVESLRRPLVQFLGSPALRVRVIGMRYTTGTPPISYAPSTFHVNMLLSWLRRAYPVGEVISSVGVVDVTAAAPGFSCDDINAQLAAIRALDMAAGGDERTHYYGLVDDGGYWMRGCTAGIPGTLASGPTGSGNWGWDFDGSYGDWYGGHELGHTYGRKHPGFCGESPSDLDNYPFAVGQIGTDASFAGFDVGDPGNNLPLAALPGTQWKDVMTYCNMQWLSPYTYLGLRQRLITEDSAGAGSGSGIPIAVASFGGRPDERYSSTAAPQSLSGISGTEKRIVSVVAIVNLDKNAGQIRFVNPLGQGKESGVERDSQVVLRAKRSDGSVVSEHPATVKLNSELKAGDDRVGVLDAAIMLDKDTTLIELLINDKLADAIALGGALPSVRAVRRHEDRLGNELSLAVEAEGFDPRKHRYAVQVSTDTGHTWHTVGVNLTEPRFNIDRTQFKAGAEVQVRVLVTNGLDTTVVTMETFKF